MKKCLKIASIGIFVFLISFSLLWCFFGVVRLHEFNGELRTHVEFSQAIIDETTLRIANENTAPEGETEETIMMKRMNIKYTYLLALEEGILEERNSIIWSLLDVYSRQRALWWGHWALVDGDFLVDQWEDYFVSPDSEKTAKLESIIREKKEDTTCFLQSQPPPGLLNERAYVNIEPLRLLLQEICSDSDREDDLLYTAYQSEAALYLSEFIQGFSKMKWYEKPIYGGFPQSGFVTFRYIWLDISYILGISFFISGMIMFWYSRRNKENVV